MYYTPLIASIFSLVVQYGSQSYNLKSLSYYQSNPLQSVQLADGWDEGNGDGDDDDDGEELPALVDNTFDLEKRIS